MKDKMSGIRSFPLVTLALFTLAACDNNSNPEPQLSSGQDSSMAENAAPQQATSSTLSTIVETKSGKVSGEVVEGTDDKIRIFKGIPYAAPPVGELRWKAPQPVQAWSDVRDATEFGPRCAQGESSMGETNVPPSEDCLYLNVVTSAQNAGDKLPVMVFFHGGGLTSGTGNSPLYTNHALPAKGVVTVTVNSRLGPIGYMAHPALTAESENNASGNYGTLDLIASLHWVQDNIANFGGDPDNVLIFGESGGGTKTLSVLSSPLAEGLADRAIIESGSASISPERVTTLQAAEERGEKLAAKVGAKDLAALRATSWKDLIAAARDEDVGFRANLTVDGYVLPISVNETFKQGKQHDVPIIVGANSGERGELEQNVPMLAKLASQSGDSNVYVYNFSHLPTGWREKPCVAFHGVEMPYVFGYVPEGLSVATITFLSRGGGCDGTEPGADEIDTQVADQIMSLWASFAENGDPSVEGLVEWPPYTEENQQYLDIGQKLEVKEGIENAYTAPPAREE